MIIDGLRVKIVKLAPNPNCLDCHGTGKIKLFTSIVVCKCIAIEKPKGDNYIDAILDIDFKWADDCCYCHLHPPCGFCTRYADSDMANPEYCDACGNPSSEEESQLLECPQCGQHVCVLCCCGKGTVCIDCEEAEGA